MVKKFIFLYISSIFLFHAKCKLIDVKAHFEPNSNILVYNGKIYTISNDSNIPENDHKIIALNSEKEENVSFFDGFWFNLIGFTILACFAGTMSGLTVGYLSIDMLILEIKMK